MEVPDNNADSYRGSSATTSTSNQRHQSRRYTGNNQFSASNFFHSPLSTFREYTGISRKRNSSHPESSDSSINGDNNHGEVSIRIIGDGELDHRDDVSIQPIATTNSSLILDSRSHGVSIENNSHSSNGNQDAEASNGAGVNNNTRDSQSADWFEEVLPFSLLLLFVFIWQHLQGFLLVMWIAVLMFKSNDIILKQTALKGERKLSILTILSIFLTLNVSGVYCLYGKYDLLNPLLMLTPIKIPPFWNAVFIIVVNDILVRQAAMVVKCFVLMYYKNGTRGQNYRKQGEILTLLEYLLMVYRCMLPGPVWYCFFLNKEYGNLFSLLITGVYLIFKLTSIAKKVQYLLSAVKALSHKAIHGSYATIEQVNVAGDVCVICQEKMNAPLVLLCKHIFCEDCVSEWFERERTCPLCRAVVKPSDVKSFADGSTSLFFQLF